MKKLKFFFGLLFSISILTSCTKTYVYLVSNPYDLKSLIHKSVTVVATDELLLKGFIKTFNEKYLNKRIFATNYVTLIKEQLSLGNTFSRIDADTSDTWHLINSFAGSKEEFVIIDSLFSKNNSDYVINVYNFELSDRLLNNAGADADGNTMTTRKEIAAVKARFQVIDRMSRRPILEFESSGEKAVSFFNYAATLEKAMRTSLEHAVRYLQSGETKFKK